MDAAIQVMHAVNGAHHYILYPKQPMNIITINKHIKLVCTYYNVHVKKATCWQFCRHKDH